MHFALIYMNMTHTICIGNYFNLVCVLCWLWIRSQIVSNVVHISSALQYVLIKTENETQETPNKQSDNDNDKWALLFVIVCCVIIEDIVASSRKPFFLSFSGFSVDFSRYVFVEFTNKSWILQHRLSNMYELKLSQRRKSLASILLAVFYLLQFSLWTKSRKKFAKLETNK